tara:strand:- start:1353 stop:2816 length:1464 start_codon:yes stop_codon:yes gene_type:complete
MPLVLGGSSAITPAYDIDNSCRWNGDIDDPYLSRTSPNSAPTLETKGTFSIWFKRCGTGRNDYIFTSYSGSGPQCDMWINTDDNFRVSIYDGGTKCALTTDRKFRDNSSWYHLLFSYDSTPSTPSSSSVQLWINGVKETSFSLETYPSQNDAMEMFQQNHSQMIGSDYSPPAKIFDGFLSECMGVDGQALVNTDFGKFDSASPTMWKAIDISDINVGTLGWHVDFKDSANLGNDVSSVGVDFTETNLAAADQATDTPTNNFATLNQAATTSGLGVNLTFSEGNLKIANTGSGAWEPTIGTIGAKGGKWYCEVKCVTGFAENYGIMDPKQYDDTMSADNPATVTLAYGMNYATGAATNGPSNWTTSWGESYGTGDIISIAMDLDNMKLYFAKNGTWVASGDPTSGATGTGTQTFFGGSGDTTNAAGVDTYTFFVAIHNNSVSAANFGGCSGFDITSANQDANGYGNFEYAVPSGYYALCTKNLAEFGG